MNLTELSDLLASATDVLRVETLDAYSSPSDADYLARFRAGEPKPDPAEKQPWLDRLAAAAERGHPWRRLRVVSRPVTEYVRYACEWGYVDNVAAGEDVRVLDLARGVDSGLRGDVYVLDGKHVIGMDYIKGAFHSAISVTEPRWHRAQIRMTASGWKRAEPFADWWAANPSLHRSLTAA